MDEQSLNDGESMTAEAAKLTHRRRQMHVANSAATAATAKLTKLEARLESLVLQRRQQKIALREAKNRQTALKKAIKASGKQREELRGSVKSARKAVAKAQRNAHEVEVKYDRAVLSDLVRREKRSDLSTHPARGAAAGTPAAVDASPHAAVAAIAAGPERSARGRSSR